MVKMRTLLNSVEGVKLEDWLSANQDKIKHKRLFYVLAPNMEKKRVFKFGIGGINTGKPYQRLHDYTITYGNHDKSNECKGVKAHFIGITEYNRLVKPENSQVYQLELKLKQKFKQIEALADGRGTERVLSVKVSVFDILEKIKEIIPTVKDTPTEITRVAREKTKVYCRRMV